MNRISLLAAASVFFILSCTNLGIFLKNIRSRAYEDNRSVLNFESGAFDPDKPTIVFFGGGNCTDSWDPTESWESEDTEGDAWFKHANVISFSYYEHDLGSEEISYLFCAQMLVDTIRALAPDYKMDMQACGFSTGGTPALDLGVFVNSGDSGVTYSVTRVTLMDSPCYDYTDRIRKYMDKGADGKPRLIENLRGGAALAWDEMKKPAYPGVLNVDMFEAHDEIYYWYVNSLTNQDLNQYNNGIGAGAYWSVVGPGKGVGLPSEYNGVEYHFVYDGDEHGGSFRLADPLDTSARLPHPTGIVVIDPRPHIHDPSEIHFENDHYITFSTGKGIQNWARHRDSAIWKPSGVLSQPDWWAETFPTTNGYFWAPCVPEKWVMYYSFEADEDYASAIGRAVATGMAPNLTWQDDGPVLIMPDCRDNGTDCPVAIDPAVFRDAEGELYMAFGSGTSGIWIVELDKQTGHLSAEASKG